MGPGDLACSRGLADWLDAQQLSLAFTSYLSGQLFFAGVEPNGYMGLHVTRADRPMGLYADPDRLVLACRTQLWTFGNVLAPGRSDNGADRHYVPRYAFSTGDLDIHDVGVTGDGAVIFCNTLFSCLATPSLTHSFKPIWAPSFISRLAPEDRCHLNGLAMRDGRPAFVTATSRSDMVDGWRTRRSEGGCVIDVASGAVVTEGLSMPHSPRWRNGELWVLNSGTGHLGVVDLNSGAFEPRAFCPGFLRGLAFHGDFALVGLSQPRSGSFTGLQLETTLQARGADPWCGIQVIDLRSGDIVHWLRFLAQVSELFDVCVLPGVRRPYATATTDDAISRLINIEPA
jgi:uncharacterized protein (TIGR03032 family)